MTKCVWGQVSYACGSSATKSSGSMGRLCVPTLVFTEDQRPLGVIDVFTSADIYFVLG